MKRTFSNHKWWILTACLCAPLGAVAASVPNIFISNTAISAAQVNQNFQGLSDRLTAIETAQQTHPPVPPKAVVAANLSAQDLVNSFSDGKGKPGTPYEGWGLCNGANGTPNVALKFLRFNATGAGPVGGTNDIPAHSHKLPWGFDAGGNVYADFDLESPSEVRPSANSGAYGGLLQKRTTSSPIRVQYSATEPVRDNRPEFVELVCLMKL